MFFSSRPKPVERTPESVAAPECEVVSLEINVGIYAAGLNGALARPLTVEPAGVDLIEKAPLLPGWRPHRPRIKTFGLTFPDGLQFLPPKEETDGDDNTELKPIAPPKPHAGEGQPKSKKVTRLKPPADALSLEDRLFYVLQPPLESWLAGQELIMPFEPFPYQYEGIAWLFSRKSALLADEMGLGKTMQTITGIRLLLRSGQVRKVALICPKPLIPNWQREFKTWAEELPIVTIEGHWSRRQMLWKIPGVPIRLVNYETFVRDFEALPEEDRPQFDLLVLDEAQRIKNRDSRTATTVRSVGRRRSWALTGTPIENRPEELASLFEYLEVIPPRGTPDLRQLSQLADIYILRRTKDLVMTDLPPRLDREEYLPLTPAQAHSYHTAEKEGVVQLNDMGDEVSISHVFELVLRLKQIANRDPLTGDSSKLERRDAALLVTGDTLLFEERRNGVRLRYLRERGLRFRRAWG
jgi:SNF2 family DNA or RNA helicase